MRRAKRLARAVDLNDVLTIGGALAAVAAALAIDARLLVLVGALVLMMAGMVRAR